jgi:hypothetical protein
MAAVALIVPLLRLRFGSKPAPNHVVTPFFFLGTILELVLTTHERSVALHGRQLRFSDTPLHPLAIVLYVK